MEFIPPPKRFLSLAMCIVEMTKSSKLCSKQIKTIHIFQCNWIRCFVTGTDIQFLISGFISRAISSATCHKEGIFFPSVQSSCSVPSDPLISHLLREASTVRETWGRAVPRSCSTAQSTAPGSRPPRQASSFPSCSTAQSTAPGAVRPGKPHHSPALPRPTVHYGWLALGGPIIHKYSARTTNPSKRIERLRHADYFYFIVNRLTRTRLFLWFLPIIFPPWYLEFDFFSELCHIIWHL